MPYIPETWTDEELADDPLYDILTDEDVPISEDVKIELATDVTVAGTPVNAERMNHIEQGIADVTDLAEANEVLIERMTDSATELTIASGEITVTQDNHSLQPESSTTDELTTISGTVAGQSGRLVCSDAGTDTITIKHGVDNISCFGALDISLSHGTVFWYSNGTTVFVGGTPASVLAWGAKSVPSGAVVGISDTQTLTNKRITPRVTSEASSATPTINTDNTDIHRITALATAITSFTTNLSGTPTHGQKLIIEILDNGTAREITWGASFRANVDLPDTTTISKLLRVGFMWDSVDSIWDCVAVSEEQ